MKKKVLHFANYKKKPFIQLNLKEWRDMEMMQQGNNKLREECVSWRLKFEALKKFAIDNKIPVPPELENP